MDQATLLNDQIQSEPDPMRIVFFGTSEFAVPALQRLADSVVLVVSQPDRPSGRGMRLHPSPVTAAALDLGLPIERPQRCREPQVVELVRSAEPDFLVVAAYGQILPKSLLGASIRGAFNLHGSILPLFRGAAPIQRSILDGCTETGVTLMQMDAGMDTGDIIDTTTAAIGPDETYSELQDRLKVLAADLIERWAPRLKSGDYPRLRQEDAQATYAPKVEKGEAEISVLRSAEVEYRRFRAFTVSPGAWIRTRFGVVRLQRIRLGTHDGEPGRVLSTREGLEIACLKGSLVIVEAQPEGRKRLHGRDLANGWRLKTGDLVIDGGPEPT